MNDVYKFGLRVTVTLRLHYKVYLIPALWGNTRCLFAELHETHKKDVDSMQAVHVESTVL